MPVGEPNKRSSGCWRLGVEDNTDEQLPHTVSIDLWCCVFTEEITANQRLESLISLWGLDYMGHEVCRRERYDYVGGFVPVSLYMRKA